MVSSPGDDVMVSSPGDDVMVSIPDDAMVSSPDDIMVASCPSTHVYAVPTSVVLSGWNHWWIITMAIIGFFPFVFSPDGHQSGRHQQSFTAPPNQQAMECSHHGGILQTRWVWLCCTLQHHSHSPTAALYRRFGNREKDVVHICVTSALPLTKSGLL